MFKGDVVPRNLSNCLAKKKIDNSSFSLVCPLNGQAPVVHGYVFFPSKLLCIIGPIEVNPSD